MANNDIEKQIMEYFKVFDKKGDGFIELDLIKQVLIDLGEKLTDEEMVEMIKDADANEEGLVYYKDFVKKMMVN